MASDIVYVDPVTHQKHAKLVPGCVPMLAKDLPKLCIPRNSTSAPRDAVNTAVVTSKSASSEPTSYVEIKNMCPQSGWAVCVLRKLPHCVSKLQVEDMLSECVAGKFQWSMLQGVDSVDIVVCSDVSSLAALRSVFETSIEPAVAALLQGVTASDAAVARATDAYEAYKVNGYKYESSEALESSEYQIDTYKLRDLPREALSQLSKDIREFRSRVLNIERSKRQKELERERKRARQQLLAAVQSTHAVDVVSEEDDVEEDDQEYGLDADLRLHNDYLASQEAQRKRELSAITYRVAELESRLANAVAATAAAGSYAQTLSRDRDANVATLGAATKRRKPRDASEEEQDDADRKANPQVTIEIDQGPSRVQKLRESKIVDNAVAEFLGENEPELVDYIIDHIAEFNSRDALVSELRETFDDDSEEIVSRIWAFLESQ